MNDLVKKYNVPVPRYTSYPTVPFWNDTIDLNKWKSEIKNCSPEGGISIYIHLPFCETLCTYCGCNKKITKNHSVEEEYINIVLKDWQLYLDIWNKKPLIKEIHLGGGTPTFFSPKNLKKLIESILSSSEIHSSHEFSIEGHPNNTTVSHLETLYNLGFKRISYGVQDNDPEVQKIINRIQPVANVQKATDNARKAGFTSVNFDLIYGLPRQNKERIIKTVEQSIAMRPDRIAFYSYAHVPWTSRGQRLFDETDLPSADEKLELYKVSKELFIKNGYYDIGMDHFALPHDDLYIAQQQGRLHRNFMGYTTNQTKTMIGLGVSAISDTGSAFAQNEKKLQNYISAVENNVIPVVKGYFLSQEDLHFKKYILDLICKGETTIEPVSVEMVEKYSLPALAELIKDGLVQHTDSNIKILPEGKNFIRNICSCFDLYLLKKDFDNQNLFSKAI